MKILNGKEKIMDNLLMVSQVGRMLNRSAESVRSYEKAGKLPAIRTSDGKRLFRESDVRELAAKLQAKDQGKVAG